MKINEKIISNFQLIIRLENGNTYTHMIEETTTLLAFNMCVNIFSQYLNSGAILKNATLKIIENEINNSKYEINNAKNILDIEF